MCRLALPVEAIHKVMAACRGQEVAGNCVVAMSVHSSVEFDDDVDSSVRRAASAAAAYAEAALVIDSDGSGDFGDSDDLESSLELVTVKRSSAESAVAAIETRIRCPVRKIEMDY